MQLIRTTECSAQTPEGMFASKYTWLLRWALHFSHNNRAAAEDLVQDAFLKLLLSWDSLSDLENIEPLLYSYLKYAHLTEQRRGQQYSFQCLSTIDYDTLAIRLYNSRFDDRIELQDELRRIVAFLLWRKNSARFASVFLLRFFHGYFPDEIMQICRNSRHAVDLSLRYAREELRSHLRDPDQIKVIHTMRSSQPELPQPPLSRKDFVDDLRRWIFSACETSCLTAEELRRRYESFPQTQIETGLLSHIVSCERCLDEVSRTLGVPPASRRNSGDSLGPAPRTRKTKKAGAGSDKEGLERVLAAGQRRMREVREHYPRGLMLALNGQVIAVRDLNSRWAELKVEVPSIDTVDLIEVISDQGLPLLAFPLRKLPPQAAPEQRHEVALSGGRMMSLLVRFTANGALIEITYDDPSFAAKPLEEASEPFEIADESGSQNPVNRRGSDEILSKAESKLPRRWWGSVLVLWNLFRERSSPLPVFAALLLLFVAGGIWLGIVRSHPPVMAGELLHRAIASDNDLATRGIGGAVHQRVEIRAGTHSVRRDLYRDIQGKRHRKPEKLEESDRLLKERLEAAGIDWNDPLSAADFLAWHGNAGRYHDVIAQEGQLLTLRTASSDGIVQEESLTVREADFHPVMRSVQFRDKAVVEVAELSYDVVPWNDTSNSWFDTVGSTPPRMQLHQPAHLSDAQIYEAELNALLVLKQLHADTERLQVDTVPNGVEVKGVVETDERKRQISSQLRAVAHVTPRILCYADLEKHPFAVTAVTSVAAITVTSQPSPLESYFELKAWKRGDCATLSHELLQSSTTIYREGKVVDELLTRFGSRSGLSETARATLRILLLEHLNALIAAVGNQEQLLAKLAAVPPPALASQEETTLVQAAQRNLDLSKELLYSSSEQSRTAPLILADLASSVSEVRAQVVELQRSPLINSTAATAVDIPQH